MSESLNDVVNTLTTEEDVPSLDDFAEFQSTGSWPVGWYSADVIEGYSTQKGKVFQTEDSLSAKGDSRNARFCFRVQGPGGERTMNAQINYIPVDFAPDRLAAIKEALKAGQNRDRHSLSVLRVQAIEKALGFKLRTTEGTLSPQRSIGQRIDLHLTVSKKTGYNEINKFNKAGTHGPKANGKG